MHDYILLAETGSDIPEDLMKRYGVVTVPMHVAFDTVTKDDRTFPVTDIYRFFETTGKLTTTSGSTVGDFEEVYDRLRAEFPDRPILHLAYSAVTTCSYQSAVIAAEGRENITSFDTKHVSAGQTLVILLLARFLEANPQASLPEILEKAGELSRRVKMGFFPGDLAYLRAGGRVSNAAYLGAKILSLNPLIEILDGQLKATKKYRGKMEKVALQLLREFPREQRFSKEILVFVYSEGLDEAIRTQADDLARELGYREILWIPTGGVVTTHSGPGAFGICGVSEE